MYYHSSELNQTSKNNSNKIYDDMINKYHFCNNSQPASQAREWMDRLYREKIIWVRVNLIVMFHNVSKHGKKFN